MPSFAFVPCATLEHARADVRPSVEPELDSIDLARALLADGRRSYRARDFVRAAEQWELAYALMTGIDSLHADSYALAFDLAEAQLRVAALGETIVDRDVDVYADYRDRQRRTRSLQTGAGITAALLGVAGTSMLTVGLMRRRHTVMAAPMLSSTSVGAQLRLAW